MHGAGRGGEPAAYRRLRLVRTPLLPQLVGLWVYKAVASDLARAGEVAQQVTEVGSCRRWRGRLGRVGIPCPRIDLALGWLLLVIVQRGGRRVRFGRRGLRLGARL